MYNIKFYENASVYSELLAFIEELRNKDRKITKVQQFDFNVMNALMLLTSGLAVIASLMFFTEANDLELQ